MACSLELAAVFVFALGFKLWAFSCIQQAQKPQAKAAWSIDTLSITDS